MLTLDKLIFHFQPQTFILQIKNEAQYGPDKRQKTKENL
jgi:hypothetical protein